MASNIIKRQIVTEKSTRLKESKNIYVFEVSKNAGINAVANEIKRLFNVEPLNINVCVMPGKKRRMYKTNRFTRLSGWKKAFVKIKDGQSIDPSKLEKLEKESRQTGKKANEKLDAKEGANNA